MDEKLYIYFTKFCPILTAWKDNISPKKRLVACNISQTASTRGVPKPFVRNALVALRGCLPRQGNERTASTSFSSQSVLCCGILYSAHYWPREMQIWVITAS